VFFLDADEGARARAKALIVDVLAGGPVQVLGWRPVPVRPDLLPPESRSSEPLIEQLVLRVEGDDGDQVERWLYRRRLELRHRLTLAKLDVYVPSLSARLLNYKGLLTSFQLADYYPDLSDPAFESGLAIFHRRYSTNTYPNWTLAQPFRFSCHNGEINTVRTNRNAVHAYARGLEPALPGTELLTANMSDSASLDEWLEHLILEKNWSLLRALRLTVPPVWESEADVWGPEAVDVFIYYRRAFGSLCAWDGPAGIVSTDGRVVAGLVDRMGLRPVRWFSDQRGWLYIASESGVFGLDNATIVASGQLQPGQMIALDTATGERLDSHQVLDRIVTEVNAELGNVRERNRGQILVPESFDFAPQLDDQIGQVLETRTWTVDHLLQAHGWDFERAVFVKDMAKLKKEPLSSMGFDRVLTIFSQQHQTLYKYLQQTFAEVTNPPIDPYREGGAMSLTTYLGRSPLVEERGGPGAMPCRQMELSGPMLTDAALEEVRRHEVLGLKTFSAVFPLRGGADALREGLHRLRSEAERAVHDGYNVLCLSDKEAFSDGLAPIPSLLSLAAVHTYLCHQGLRERCSLVVQAGDVQEGHDIACLVGFGADAVHPYLMLRLIRNGLTFKDPDTKQAWALTGRECLENLFAALEDTFKKIISKMGITTVEGYRGARLFEAVGFGPELMEFLGDCPSRIGGIGISELVEDAQWRLGQAEKMQVLGRNRDYHAFNAKVRMALRKAALAGSSASLPLAEDGTEEKSPKSDFGGEDAYAPPQGPLTKEYLDFADMVNSRTPTCLRDLFTLKLSDAAVPIAEVQAGGDLVRNHFRGAAMSHGALTKFSHQDIAAALNELDGLSNSGEGGESRHRNDAPERPWGPFWERVLAERAANPDELTLGGDLRRSRLRSRIRQIASGRFGVDAEYLINGEELQIKMAQGAKPGEGGQLMGKKVTSEIAEIRYGKPGTDLISPPPHHDIYSIEDLAQLIYDLKAVNPGTPVSVKLVAVENVGTIAVGVAKAGADVIEIDGIGGGTGAAMASSKEHAGLPSEMGLAEAHQALVVNGLRQAVKLRVGGGIKNGVDVVKYALLGAEEFSFGQALMVSVGCIVCKSCHIPNCPTGITGAQGEYKGQPNHTKTYLLSVAEEVRGLLAGLGARHISEIVGRTELLVRNPEILGRSTLVDVSRFLQPDMALNRLDVTFPQHNYGVCSPDPNDRAPLNVRIVEAARDAIETCQNADLMFRIRNSDRSVGATAAGLIAKLYGREGLPNHKTVKVRFEGEAGQSFGAWCVNGLDLELRGFAQDGVAKGISGGAVVVTLNYGVSSYGGEIQSVAGNNVGYGATGGKIFIGGRAGHRLGIRNSGATIVAEAAGKYACEYLTRGRVLILGPIENEIGSGMTGGELFVYDPRNEVPAKIHTRSVAVIECNYIDYEWIHPLIINYHARTESRQAELVLTNWAEVRRGRRLRKVVPLAVARKAEEYIAAGSNAG
jgi:glutamate synthase domain-containing protein 2/glutamate synthase domain-containing protein 3/glutamate synthase domain-containing protein 1